MEFLKRYSISFAIAGFLLYYFTIWVEEKYEGRTPHNLSTKNEEKAAITLLPKRYYEKCVDLSPAQQLQYGFNSNAALAFNIHYHEEGEQYYPVKEDSITEMENTFQSEKRAYYCLKWGNSRAEGVKMDFHFKILNRGSDND